MSKRYHPERRRVLMAAVALAAVAVALLTVHAPLGELVRAHAAMLLSGSRNRFATADSRAGWLKAHPGELRLALVGPWAAAATRRTAFEKTVTAVNAAGGAAGRKLVPVWLDAGASLDALPEILTRLASDPSCFAAIAAIPADALIPGKSLLLQGRLLTFAPGVSNLRATRPDEIPYLFLPNPSDADVAAEIADLIRSTGNPGLVVGHDNTETGRGLCEELQRAFQERAMPHFFRFPLGREIMKPSVRQLVTQMHEFHGIDHAAYLNAGCAEERAAVAWLLKNMPGKLVLSRPVPGEWTDEERSRMFLPFTAEDEADERSVWLLADAVGKAKMLHPDAVSAVLCDEELKTPKGPFRFSSRRFMAK